MLIEMFLFCAAVFGFILGVAWLIGGRLSDARRMFGYKIAACIGAFAALLCAVQFPKWRSTTLTGELETDASGRPFSANLFGPAKTTADIAGKDTITMSGFSLKGDRYTVSKNDVSIDGGVSTVRVNWLSQDGKASHTVKAFQCGRDLHATLYRSNTPYKFDARRPVWYKVEGRGATREIYEWVCTIYSTGLTPEEGAVMAAEGGTAAQEAAEASGRAAAQNDNDRRLDDISEKMICERAIAATNRFDEIYAREGQARAFEDAGGEDNAIAASKTASACQKF